MSKIQLLSGSAATDALNDEPLEARFGYVLNGFAAGTALGLGLACLMAAAGIWYATRFAHTGWTAGFAVAIVLGLTLLSTASYWQSFVREGLIAVSANYLFVGRKDRLWRVDWSLLDRRSMGFEDMALSPLQGFLRMRVAGQQIRVHLFNAFAYLEDVEGLMRHVLEHLPRPELPEGDDSSPPEA